MAQCFTGNNEQGMLKKLRAKTLTKKERVLSSPPAAIQPTQIVQLKTVEVMAQRSASLNQMFTSPKAPSSPGLRNVNKREQDVILCTARALYGYPNASDLKLEEDSEIKLLRFHRGDDIFVFEKDESGWWAGCCGSNKGIFPGSFVKVIDDPDLVRAGEFRKRSKTSPQLIHVTEKMKATPSPQLPHINRQLSQLSQMTQQQIPQQQHHVPQFSPLVIDHHNDIPADSTELLYEKYLSEQLVKYDNELLRLKAQIDGKDKLIELLTRENMSVKLELAKMQDSFVPREASTEKSVFFQKQLLETEMQLACSKVELEDINKSIEDAKETLKKAQQQIDEHKTNGVPTAHLNVAAIKKSLQLQQQLKMMKTHLDEETASRKDAEQQVADSQKHMETIIQASKSKGFDLKIAHKINIVLAGMLGTPDLSNDQIMEMLKKLKDAVSVYIINADMSLIASPPSFSSPSSSSSTSSSTTSSSDANTASPSSRALRSRSISTPSHLNVPFHSEKELTK